MAFSVCIAVAPNQELALTAGLARPGSSAKVL